MNRHNRRADAVQSRKPQVSVALLQKRLEEQSLELQQLRNVLFAHVKSQGRIRVLKAAIDSLTEADGLDAVLSRDGDGAEAYVIQYKRHGDQPPGAA